MKKLFVLVTLLSLPAWAHFQIGTYTGVSSLDRSPCSFEIKSVDFKDGMHHPLNEKVQMVIHFMDNLEVEMTHLPVVDAVQGTVRPKAHVLSAVKANASGAWALEMIMNEEGPVQMLQIEDNYKDKSLSARSACMELKFQSAK